MKKTFLIIESPYYKKVTDYLVQGAISTLVDNNADYERIEVPGALEIPVAIKIASEGKDQYAGYIALGCVLRGETSHYDIVCNESARGLSQLALEDNLAIGNGILTCETLEQAIVRADPKQKNKGRDAALAALRIFELKQKYKLK